MTDIFEFCVGGFSTLARTWPLWANVFADSVEVRLDVAPHDQIASISTLIFLQLAVVYN